MSKKKPKLKGVVGEVVMERLDKVKPNDWNPNKMTDHQKRSLGHGLVEDGWMASQALLVWGEDENGERKDVIIDGEHRWFAGRDVGFEEAPMVFIDGINEAEAKALTIKMDSKRGEFDRDQLAELVSQLQFDLGADDLGLELGIDDEELMKMMAVDPTVDDSIGGAAPGEGTTPPDQTFDHRPAEGQTDLGHIRLVQLFFTEDQHTAFQERMKVLGERYGTKNVTDTVFAAVKEAEDYTVGDDGAEDSATQ